MAKIRHIAILTTDTNALASFYVNTFGLHEVMRRDKPNGAIYLSDGYINLAILPNDAEAEGAPDGLHHFGFQVDDVDRSAQEAMRAGATQGRSGVPVDGRFAEAYVKDPIGQRVDLSAGGWAV
jgi:catechol 2,3-dioxygenase-like lactoylglutathione lyase family enzyme